MTADEETSRRSRGEDGERPRQSHPVSGGAAGTRWPRRAGLTERQVTAERRDTTLGERFRERDEDGGVLVAPGAVGEDDARVRGPVARMERATHGGDERIVDDRHGPREHERAMIVPGRRRCRG